MTISSQDRLEVDKLIALYAAYRSCSEEQARATRKLAKAKLKGEPTDDLEKDHQQLTQKLQSISDAMTFANPLIWALYKFEAYANESQPIRNMQDFRLHCSKPGYICTKRFMFVNYTLRNQGLPPLSSKSAYADKALLSRAFNVLHTLSQNKSFIKTWETHEYYKRDGVVAKWEDFAE